MCLLCNKDYIFCVLVMCGNFKERCIEKYLLSAGESWFFFIKKERKMEKKNRVVGLLF